MLMKTLYATLIFGGLLLSSQSVMAYLTTGTTTSTAALASQAQVTSLSTSSTARRPGDSTKDTLGNLGNH